MSGPEVYLKKIKAVVLESQCIPTDPELWQVDQAHKFWQARKELLADAFNDFLRSALPNRRV